VDFECPFPDISSINDRAFSTFPGFHTYTLKNSKCTLQYFEQFHTVLFGSVNTLRRPLI